MRWTRIGGMTALVVALAIGLALSLGLWGSWTASAQDTFIVNDDTTPAADGCDTPDFQTEDIEDAVDSPLVADGDTLAICEGTYNAPDTIEVTKKLTIEGLATADREDVVVQGSSNGFDVKADDVTIMHLKLLGPGTAGGNRGVYLVPVGPTAHKNLELSDLEITNWDIGVFIAESNDAKIGPNNKIHANAIGVTITGGILGGQRDMIFNNEIGLNEYVGLNLAQVDEAYVQENTLAGNVTLQIQVSGESNAFIWNNDIEATATQSGILIASDTADTLVQIGGSPQRTNNFTGTTAPTISWYVTLECGSENTVDAAYNYWSGINSNAGISAVVFNDEFDDPASGTADCPGEDAGAVAVHPFVTTQWTPSSTPTPSATATPTPSPTATATATPPGATRAVDLSPPGWHSLVWSGADATDPGTALACIAGKYSIAYAWEGPTAGFKRHVEGCGIPGICNMSPLNKYAAMLVSISAAATCQMPVVP